MTIKLNYEQRYRPVFTTQGLKNRVLHDDWMVEIERHCYQYNVI